MAVNPADPSNIVVAWTQDWMDGIVVGVTHDGGETWSKSVPPMTSFCSEGNHNTTDHAHISYDNEGRLYLSTWSSHERLRTRVTVHVSTNGGASWSQPVTLEETAVTGRHYTEWSWVVSDPIRSDTAYATWTSVDVSDPGYVGEFEMRFARTTDGGMTWSPPRDMSSALADHDRYVPQLLVLPNGSLVNFFFQFAKCPTTTLITELSCDDTAPVMAARSIDQGDTWSPPVEVAFREDAFRYAEEPRVVKLGHGPAAHPPLSLPAVSENGTIYYTWVEYGPDFAGKLFLTSSSDEGLTWAAPTVIRESDEPMANPNIAVAPDGTVGVLFYDFRNDDPGTDAAETDVWFISAPANSLQADAWEEQHLAGPFDVFSIPDHAGINQGIVGTAEGFITAYTVGAPLSTVGPTDIFFSRIDLGPGPGSDTEG